MYDNSFFLTFLKFSSFAPVRNVIPSSSSSTSSTLELCNLPFSNVKTSPNSIHFVSGFLFSISIVNSKNVSISCFILSTISFIYFTLSLDESNLFTTLF